MEKKNGIGDFLCEMVEVCSRREFTYQKIKLGPAHTYIDMGTHRASVGESIRSDPPPSPLPPIAFPPSFLALSFPPKMSSFLLQRRCRSRQVNSAASRRRKSVAAGFLAPHFSAARWAYVYKVWTVIHTYIYTSEYTYICIYIYNPNPEVNLPRPHVRVLRGFLG